MKNFYKKYLTTIVRTFITVLLILLQIGLIILMSRYLHDNAVFIYVVLDFLSFLCIVVLTADTRDSSYKIFWLGVVLIIPIAGCIMFLMWGRENAQQAYFKSVSIHLNEIEKLQEADEDLQSIYTDGYGEKESRYLTGQGFPLYSNEEVKYYAIGEDAFAEIKEDLRQAKRYIFLSFFIIADGQLWDEIKQILIRKAIENIEIKIMYDDIGSIFQLSDLAFQELRSYSNVEVRGYNPIEHGWYTQHFQYRNHQKIVVVDGMISYTGGVNISDSYVNIRSPHGHWKDIAIRLNGNGSYSFTLIFLSMWNASGSRSEYNKYKVYKKGSGTILCQPFADGPANNPSNPARDMYRLLITEARKEIFIMTPYLILDNGVRDSLCLSARSGVDVRIITPGIPDKKTAKLLTEWNYGPLLQAGVKIYEYTPGFIHAKLCLNESSALIGTINMDYRSFYLHYECGVWLQEPAVQEQMRQDFFDTLAVSSLVTYEMWQKRPIYKKTLQMFLQMFRSQF